MTLRLITYLVPAVPLELYEAVAAHLESRLGQPVSLAVDSTRSGPEPGGGPLADGSADLAFVCSLAVLELAPPQGPGRHVLGAAVPSHVRAGGEPRYWSDLVLAPDVEAGSFTDLVGGSLAYNDERSLSGLWALAARLAEGGRDWSFFGDVRRSGGHLQSLALLSAGDVDVAAIDSIVFERVCAQQPELCKGLRRLEALGPFPSPPLVTRADLPAAQRRAILEALLEPALGAAMRPFGFSGFAPLGAEPFERWRPHLERGLALGVPA